MSQTDTKSNNKYKNSNVHAYLIVYNFIQALGWSSMLALMALHFAAEETYKGMYGATHMLLKIFQTAGLLEVVHAMLGFVKSNAALTFLQLLSRVAITWGVAYSIREVQDHYSYTMFTLAWCITEIIRYSFYTFSLIDDQVPFLLKWARYTFFIFLYPIGVTGELISIYSGIPYAYKSKLYSVDLPNAANMSVHYYILMILGMIAYIPVFPQLYFHMLSQRKKVLGAPRIKKE